jgi:hypothetical protein
MDTQSYNASLQPGEEPVGSGLGERHMVVMHRSTIAEQILAAAVDPQLAEQIRGSGFYSVENWRALRQKYRFTSSPLATIDGFPDPGEENR